ncbi:MAG: TolC family protein, partial [Armatimonadota bacterium]
LKFSSAAVDGSVLQAGAASKRPEVALAEEHILAARGEIKAARLLRVPDLALQARRESFEKDSSDGVAVVIRIPILDWGSAKAEKERAAKEVESREKQLETVKNAVSLDVEQAMQRVNTATGIVRDYEGGILENSEQLAAMPRKGYEKGASNYLEVLEAQRTLRSIKSAYYSALAEHAIALAQLEWASGGSFKTNSSTEVKR